MLLKESEESIELLLRNRVELVIVAARAAERQPQKSHSRRVDTIDHGFDAILLEVDAAFQVQQGIAVKARRYDLLFGGVRQEDLRRSARSRIGRKAGRG